MNWIYTNNTPAPVIYRSETWLPGETRETTYPLPDALGLTCIQQGDIPDPVLFHSDITIPPGGQTSVNISPPTLSHAVHLSIACMTPESGCECRFNSPRNSTIPIDSRGFQQKLSWENCSCIFLSNSTDIEAIVSITAIEAV